VRILRPLSPRLTRPLSLLAVLAWVVQMGLLLNQAYLQAAPVTLAADLSRYGASAHWKGIYYRGEKVGFSVSQTLPTADGYELQEDGELQLTLMGVGTVTRLRTRATVDKAFSLETFSFTLEPATGPITVAGRLEEATRLHLRITTPTGERTETRELDAAPALSLNLARRLAAAGLETGQRIEVPMFDPATLTNAPMVLDVGDREIVRINGRPLPAFRVESHFAGIHSTSWVTDVGEVVKEESPMGLVVVKESRDRAIALAVPGDVRSDMLEAAAVVPKTRRPIDDPAAVELLRVELTGIDAAAIGGSDLQGAGQSVQGDIFEVRSADKLDPGPSDPEAARHLSPEPFIESDDPQIVREAETATAGAATSRERAERLVRYVNALLEKKPTVSLPSAREVLRTKVGDCNEHTVLYVAMARAAGIPSRVAVGLVLLHGAFYYHAWPEVYLEEPDGRGLWAAVDPTLNQYPADATHVRLARGGLDRQARILPLIGKTEITVLDFEMRPGSTPILVGREAPDARPFEIALPQREGSATSCWSRPGR
jgi:transglutaminase-like putative cysteine protease